MEREGCLAKKRERRALAGNRTRVSRVGGENSTTEPPMPRVAALGPGSFRRSVGKLFFFFFFFFLEKQVSMVLLPTGNSLVCWVLAFVTRRCV